MGAGDVRRIVTCATIAMALAACAPEPTADEQSRPAAEPAIEYNAQAADLDLPCSLITRRDAEWLTGRPFHDTLAINRVDGERVRCIHAVGEGGVQGAVQVDVYRGDDLRPVSEIFARQCRPDAGRAPSVAQEACVTLEGAYAAVMGERVFVVAARRDPTTVNQALSLRLLNLVSGRALALRDG
jgi:hypothetical protein